MRAYVTVAAVLPLYLTLTACPAPTAEVRPQLAYPGLGPRNLIFTPREITFGVPKKQGRGLRALPLLARSYTLMAGDEIIWKIERRECDERNLPIEIVYGESPVCFRETFPAKPLEPGRSYRLQGDSWQMIDFTYSDPIQRLSARGYAVRTRKWQREHP